jgi:hypothetical protein
MASSLLQLNCRLMPKLDLTKFMYAWDKLCPNGEAPDRRAAAHLLLLRVPAGCELHRGLDS